ncbi:hypothetical protein AVEN_59051-1 [Araneus ventricosus]|uniref:Uncharacterized protein n=1 Tax=Araneus ventricosus TaxID=182803 RepID=A0A4Y2E939_ARAVE|nr:hypothetical protein AVEN_59051-1 [Araneus ventricosus]
MNNSRRKNNKETEGRVPMAINGLRLTLAAVDTSRHRSEGNSTLHHYQERELNTSPLLREENPPTYPADSHPRNRGTPGGRIDVFKPKHYHSLIVSKIRKGAKWL